MIATRRCRSSMIHTVNHSVAYIALARLQAHLHGVRMTVFASYADKLRISHLVLRRNTMKIRDTTLIDPQPAGDDLADYTALVLKFLGLHHENEDRFLFPALREHHALRSTDAAHLDRFEREHVAVHALMDEITSLLPAVRRDTAHARRDLGNRVADLHDLLTPHLDTEEDVLRADHLATMIPEDALARCEHDQIAVDKAIGGTPVFMLLVHSLSEAEQNTLLGKLPWFVRRVLIGGFWKPGYARFRQFAY
ncbi:MAG: hemerythrin domain-containing protein [Kofleriaceae bacterium]